MMALPNATSHALAAAAGALTAFTGMSAANAGAAEDASTATTDHTTLFMTLPLLRFDRISAETRARRFCVPNPGGDRSVRNRTCIDGRTTQSANSSGKAKTAANAAFLGESGRYRQKRANCCGDSTMTSSRKIFAPGGD